MLLSKFIPLIGVGRPSIEHLCSAKIEIMKMVKYFSCLTMITLLLASCAKDNLVETIDEIPSLEPTVKEIDGDFLLRRLQFQVDTARIGATQDWGQNELMGYNLNLQPTLAGAPGIIFNLRWMVNGKLSL